MSVFDHIKRYLAKSRAGSSKKRRERERGEKTSGCLRQLIDLIAPVDLNWRNLAVYSTLHWLLLTGRCVAIGCLVLLCKLYCNMIAS